MITEFELFLIAVAGQKNIEEEMLDYLYHNFPIEPIDGHVQRIARMKTFSIQQTKLHKTITYAMILWLTNNTSIFQEAVEDVVNQKRFHIEGKFNRALFLKTFK